MKQSDDVFLFTLVDLFLQILFFGFLLVAIWYASSRNMFKSIPDHQKIIEVLKSYGVNNVTDLEDFIKNLKGSGFSNYKELLDTLSDLAKAKAAGMSKEDIGAYVNNSEYIKSNGGLTNIIKASYASATRRSCSPSNEFSQKTGVQIPNVLATAVLTKSSITISPLNDDSEGAKEFEKMLSDHNIKFTDLNNMSHSNFRKVFNFVSIENANCLHYMNCKGQTKLTDEEKGAFQSAFRCW